MVSNFLPPSAHAASLPERGAGFGQPLSAPRDFKGAGHGGDATIPPDTLAAQVRASQEFEGYEGLHSPKELEAALAAARALVHRAKDADSDKSSPLSALTPPYGE
jgi:hypothetical protein